MSGVAVNLLEDEATIMRGAIQGVRGCKKGGREYVYKGRTRMPAESFSSSIWAMGGAMGNRSGSLESTWREVAGLEEDEEAPDTAVSQIGHVQSAACNACGCMNRHLSSTVATIRMRFRYFGTIGSSSAAALGSGIRGGWGHRRF